MVNSKYVTLFLGLVALVRVGEWAQAEPPSHEDRAKVEKLRAELKSCRFKIICESLRDNNWELVIMDADGSHLMNFTQTPSVDELFPHVSPDGTKVVFLAEEGEGENRTRNVYYMNLDGTGRTKVGENGRQPFWSPDGKVIAFARGSGGEDIEGAETNAGLYFYDIASRQITRHPREDIGGLINPCWSPNGKWIVSTVAGQMGFFFSMCAIEVEGKRLVELRRSGVPGENTYQCRPDLSPDGKHVAWGKDDTSKKMMGIEVGDINLNSPEPQVTNRRYVVTVQWPPVETYHVDWSPDSQYIAYSHGLHANRMKRGRFLVGEQAPGWNLRIVKPSEPEVVVQITHDGLSYKEPDWVFVK